MSKENKDLVEKLKSVAEEFQADCHRTVEYIIDHTNNADVQDATNVWIFKKLASLEIRLKQLETFINKSNVK